MNTQKKAQDYERLAFHWLARFGALNSQQVGLLMYSDRAERDQLARRLLRRMFANGWLQRNQSDPSQFAVFAISVKGKKEVWERFGLEVETSREATRTTSHRVECDNEAIRLLAAGYSVFTEYEIQRAKAPVKAVSEKVPDGLAVFDELATWIEVENSRRSERDLKKLVGWLVNTAFPRENSRICLYGDVYLDRVRFVITSKTAAGFEARLRKELASRIRHVGDWMRDQIEVVFALG